MTKLGIVSLFAGAAALSACAKEPAKATPGRYDIAVTEAGFRPETIQVPSGRPVTLVFRRKTDATCAKDVVVHVDGTQKIEKALPLDPPVEIVATFPRPGALTCACGMDMVKGHIHVQ